ncbi:MAG: AraC family transcriptional regulator [Endozoicomonas sp.]
MLNRTDMKNDTDPFTQLIQLFRLEVEVYHNARICGDWAIQEHEPGMTCFHIVTEGRCYLDVPGYLSMTLSQGDLVIFPRELPHTMKQADGLSGKQQHLPFSESAGKKGTGMLCGRATFEHCGHRFLLDALPAVFIVKAAQSQHWLNALLLLIGSESHSPSMASTAVLNRLSEMLFVFALRQYLRDNPQESGLLGLYLHPRLRHAIQAIHTQPKKKWSLTELAGTCALSRTAFANTFKQVSGQTAMQYITWWRMQLAWSLLVLGDSVATVADQVGYQSEAAFARAFQRQFGQGAGAVRRMGRR